MPDSVDQTAAAAGISLHELKLINIGLHCIKGKAGTDIDKFTKMAGYKSNSVASTTWSRVKRHLQKVVPVVEPVESDDAEESKDGVKKRKRAVKKADDGSGDEAGPSKKRTRGKTAQKDESGDEMVNEPNTKKARDKVAKADDIDEDGAVEKTASQSAAKNGATPDDDGPPALECITVKSSGDEASPSTKKGGKAAQKGKAGAIKKRKIKAEAGKDDSSDDDDLFIGMEKPKKGAVANREKGQSDDVSDERVPATEVEKSVAAKKGNGEVVQGIDACDNVLDDGKIKDAANAGKNKGAATGNGARQTKTGKNAPKKASRKVRDEAENGSDGA